MAQRRLFAAASGFLLLMLAAATCASLILVVWANKEIQLSAAVANREGPYDKLQSTIPVTDPDPSISKPPWEVNLEKEFPENVNRHLDIKRLSTQQQLLTRKIRATYKESPHAIRHSKHKHRNNNSINTNSINSKGNEKQVTDSPSGVWRQYPPPRPPASSDDWDNNDNEIPEEKDDDEESWLTPSKTTTQSGVNHQHNRKTPTNGPHPQQPPSHHINHHRSMVHLRGEESSRGCYSTTEVLVIIGVTCSVNFAFIFLVMVIVHVCNSKSVRATCSEGLSINDTAKLLASRSGSYTSSGGYSSRDSLVNCPGNSRRGRRGSEMASPGDWSMISLHSLHAAAAAAAAAAASAVGGAHPQRYRHRRTSAHVQSTTQPLQSARSMEDLIFIT